MLFTTHWHDSKEDSISDAGLCHGDTGFVMIFKYMYDVTGDGRFAPTAQYWSGVTLDFGGLMRSDLPDTRFYFGSDAA